MYMPLGSAVARPVGIVASSPRLIVVVVIVVTSNAMDPAVAWDSICADGRSFLIATVVCGFRQELLFTC